MTTWPTPDAAFADITRGIRRAIEHLQKAATATPPQHSGPAADRSSSSPDDAFWNVPPRNPFFTGRDDIFPQLRQLLTANQTATLTQPPAISGFGGIGKTQTAIEYAYRYQKDYQYVFWVRAETYEELVTDFTAIAHLLNLPQQDVLDQQIILQAVKQWLETHSGWLLILDNADDLSLVAPHIPHSNTGHLLLTTRAYVMGALARRVELDTMTGDDGTLLLLRRAGLIAQDASVSAASEEDRVSAQRIVTELGGLPLALDQAGAYIEETGRSLTSYLTLYQQEAYRIKLLGRRGGIIPLHPLSVSTTVALALQKVTPVHPAAKDLLCFCAFLAPEAIPESLFTEGASELGPQLQPIVTDPFAFDETIAALLKYSLIHREPTSSVLSLHRLVQVMLKAEMDQETQRQWAERAVKIMNKAFPRVDYDAYPLCQALLPHAQVCATWITTWNIDIPEAARLLNQTAYYLDERAQYDEALPLYQRALAIYEKVLGPEHPDTVTSLNNLATLYSYQGNAAEALPLLQRAVTIYEKVRGPEHPDTALSLNNLAMLYNDQGNYSEALPLLQRALAIREKVRGPEHPDTARSLTNLAYLYNDQGNYSEALPLLQRALAIQEKVRGPEHPETAQTLNNLAYLYYNQGNSAEALSLYQRALAIQEKVLGPEHPTTKKVRANYNIALKEQK